jgi:hypothetical protein
MRLAIWKDVSGRLGQPTLPGKKTLQRGALPWRSESRRGCRANSRLGGGVGLRVGG